MSLFKLSRNYRICKDVLSINIYFCYYFFIPIHDIWFDQDIDHLWPSIDTPEHDETPKQIYAHFASKILRCSNAYAK